MHRLAIVLIAAAAAAAVVIGGAGCAFEPEGIPDVAPDGPGDPDPGLPADVDAGVVTPPPPPPPEPVSCRVERANLGVDGLQVTSPAGTHTFTSWQRAGGRLVGFTLAGPEPVGYEVRADDDRFWGAALTWTHPELADGDAESISRVDFCARPPGGGGGG